MTRLLEPSIDFGYSLQNQFPNVVIKLLLPVSYMHISEKLKTSPEIYLKRIEKIFDYILSKNIKVDVCFEDATRAEYQFIIKILKIIHNKNVGFITLADTVGCFTPDEYGKLFSKIKKEFPEIHLSAHCHNDLGLATANTISAVLNGAEQVETTFLGIGERAGNTAIDEVIAVLQKKKLNQIEMSLPKVFETSNKIKEIMDYHLSPTKPILGKNIFIHESGIHQDGMLKNPKMYQFLLPNELGNTNSTHYTISGISSKKILYKYFKKIADPNINIDELIVYYRSLSKITDKLTPEDCMELYILRKEESNEVIGREQKVI